MTGGIAELVARGVPDLFITGDPQITFFKTIYRHYTNFSIEAIPQYFAHTPDFGKKVSCIISRCGDLAHKAYLVIDLPSIPTFTVGVSLDSITKFAWVKKVGYAIINSIRVDIGELLIDKQYGDWLNIWSELTDNYTHAFDEIIGNSADLTEFSNGKNAKRLYIPLQFWFCRTSGLSLPLVCLMYSEVKITIELNDASHCYIIAPSHYIELSDSLVAFEQYEYIEQTVGGVTAAGIYMYFDVYTQRLYYYKLSTANFQAPALASAVTLTRAEMLEYVFDPNYTEYYINGLTTEFTAFPKIGGVQRTHSHSSLGTISLTNCFLLIDYIFLDNEERELITKSKNEFLIERITYIKEQSLTSPNAKQKLYINLSCKLIVWITPFLYNINAKDYFNYSNSYKRMTGSKLIYSGNTFYGSNPINNEVIYFNSVERLTYRPSYYYEWIQPYQNFNYESSQGINIYSFALFPEQTNPTGTFNASQIDNIDLQINMTHLVTSLNPVKFRAYAITYDVFKVSNGLGALLFAN
jgi:hypothetical protein